MEEFPGLVHFIFVDRTSHQMTAPSINISTEDVDKITAYVKKEVSVLTLKTRMHSSSMRTVRRSCRLGVEGVGVCLGNGSVCLGGLPTGGLPKGMSTRGVSAQGGSTPPPVNRMCKNITFLQLRLRTVITKYYMSHFAYACKMRYPLNLVLEKSEYLWFY